jgi:hypothetical protein
MGKHYVPITLIAKQEKPAVVNTEKSGFYSVVERISKDAGAHATSAEGSFEFKPFTSG